MDLTFTKSHPKILDYNPLTHFPFYSKEAVDRVKHTRKFSCSVERSGAINGFTNRSTYLVGKSIMRNNAIGSVSKSFEEHPMESVKFIPNFRYKLADPISGRIVVYKLGRSALANYSVDKD